MRIDVNSKQLAAQLADMGTAIQRKDAVNLPILGFVLMEADGDKLRLTATDLDNTLKLEFTPEDITEGRMCISLHRLHNLVKALPESDITIKRLDNDWAEVTTDTGKFKVAGIDPETFPETQTGEAQSWECEGADVLRGLARVAHYMDTEEDRRHEMRGVQFEINGHLRFVGTNGKCLSVCDVDPAQPFIHSSGDEPLVSWVIPRRCVLSLTRVFNASGKIVCWATDNQLFFRQGGKTLTSRRPTLGFPNYKMILKQLPSEPVVMDKAELVQALNTISVFTPVGNYNRTAKFNFERHALTITAVSQDSEDAHETLGCEYQEREKLEIGYDVDQVKLALSKVDDKAEFAIGDNKPLIIRSEAERLKMTQVLVNVRL